MSFDVWSSETKLYEDNKIQPALDKLKQPDTLMKQMGHYGLNLLNLVYDKDRVLIKGDGSYTYLTRDIAYHLNKLNRGYDYLVDLLGADHHGYIARMKAAIQALGYNANQLRN